MPFQRMLTMLIAAIGCYDIATFAFRGISPFREIATDISLAAIAGLLALLYVISPPSFIPEGDRGLVALPTTADASIADLETSVDLADKDAVPGTAILVLGSRVSWHDQMWATQWSDRPFYYDDWLWYWQTKQVGPYDPQTSHAYDVGTMAEVLQPSFLAEHGIGAVILTSTARTTAVSAAIGGAAGLQLVSSGIYDTYLVTEPTKIVTFGNANATEISVTDWKIAASGESDGGTAKIRRNWFPRWRATVNGEAVPIAESADGYMEIPVPAGNVEIELRYVVDRWDWLARIAALAGFGILVVASLPGRFRRYFGSSAS
jgi:hypothetical protein